MNKLIQRILDEPAILSGFAGIVAVLVLELIGLLELQQEAWATLVIALLGAAGITRENVTPTRKL